MKYEVRFRPRAETDLLDLYRYIAAASGRMIAEAYIDRIEAACLSLETFPERGARRDDIRPGLRVMGFERRITIVFQISGDSVTVVRIFYGGRDYERALTGASDD
ncbi:type II toxin-antitoxin system RelE/ParE family toxin [Inquilinus sp.]|uniref:type II toxin-antitoxin system RelE/ParE family toxin n=1 Tax=Inquilinus sp. TaxID=1932117 RepID=UPI0031D33669